MEVLKTVINKVNSYVWGWPEVMPLMIIILLGTGIYITFRMRWIQLFKLKHAINVIRGKYDNEEDEGDINYFQALSAALSATVGIGNIAGVATAIHYGGPGALFWMWVTAIFGMAIKFTEATLSVKYRHVHKDGTISGGPMYYIEKGLGKKWKPLAIAFAFFAMIASFGIGNSIQAFTVSDQFLSEGKLFLDSSNWLINPISFVGLQVEPIRIIVGAVLATLLAMVILGGIKRIGRVTSKLAPGMAAMYIIATFLILIFNYNEILPTFKTIFSQAFSPKAELVGLAGGGFLLFLNTMLWGVRRGLFSNEAGMGSAPIAHAAAKTKEPVREGTVAMLGPLIDTLIICSLTGLAIISTGAYNSGLNGSPLTALAFEKGLSPIISWGNEIITFAVLLFALSTAITWSYYGDRSAEYLFGKKSILPYKLVYVLFHFIGAIVSLEIVWGFGDIANGLMAIPNLIALILLAPVVVKMTKKYYSNLDNN